MTANIAFDQIPQARAGRKTRLQQLKQQATDHYQKALDLITQHNQTSASPVSEFIQYKARQNILGSYLNSVPAPERFKNQEVLSYLTESDFLPASKRVLQQEPFQWIVARNGLRFSSITQQAKLCQDFFSLLVSANKHFQDLTYKPLGYPAICDSAEFQWGIDNINRTPHDI